MALSEVIEVLSGLWRATARRPQGGVAELSAQSDDRSDVIKDKGRRVERDSERGRRRYGERMVGGYGGRKYGERAARSREVARCGVGRKGAG
jgi:hypothetical protein